MKEKTMAWCFLALLTLGIAGMCAYKWTDSGCHTKFSQGAPFCQN